MKFAPWYLRWLGFNYRYSVKCLTEPLKQEDANTWYYEVQLISYSWYWFNIRLKTIFI